MSNAFTPASSVSPSGRRFTPVSIPRWDGPVRFDERVPVGLPRSRSVISLSSGGPSPTKTMTQARWGEAEEAESEDEVVLVGERSLPRRAPSPTRPRLAPYSLPPSLPLLRPLSTLSTNTHRPTTSASASASAPAPAPRPPTISYPHSKPFSTTTTASAYKGAFISNPYLPTYSFLKPPSTGARGSLRTWAAPTLAYTCDADEADDLIACLADGPLGFDMEWKFVRRKGVSYKTALVQVCDERMVLLLHIHHMSRFPDALRALIESPTRIKCGVNIGGDSRKLTQDFPELSPRGMLELTTVAHACLPEPLGFANGRKLVALDKLAQVYLERRLDKGPVRGSDWEKTRLGEDQKAYAANDVFAGLQILAHLLAHSPSTDLPTLLRSPPPVLLPQSTSTPTSTAAAAASILHPTLPDNPAPLKIKPRHWIAYTLFFGEKLDIAEVTKRMRKPDALKRSTVLNYIAESLTLAPELELPYDAARLRAEVEQSEDYTRRTWMRKHERLIRASESLSSSSSTLESGNEILEKTLERKEKKVGTRPWQSGEMDRLVEEMLREDVEKDWGRS